jgi:SAM-dependent methyltransferase
MLEGAKELKYGRPSQSRTGSMPELPGPEDHRVWGRGDYSILAAGAILPSELLCEAVELRARQATLDVATGSGNTALSAARRRARVTGIDLLPDLLHKARERAQVERLGIELLMGDASALPFRASTFDRVLSTFGVIYAPDPALAAQEMARVCRSGGVIGLTSWVPDGFFGTVLHRLLQPDARTGPHRPTDPWSSEPGIHGLFPNAVRVASQRRSMVIRGDSPERYLAALQRYLGPVIAAFASREMPDRTQLAIDLMATIQRFNRSNDGTVYLPSDYLEIVLRKD